VDAVDAGHHSSAQQSKALGSDSGVPSPLIGVQVLLAGRIGYASQPSLSLSSVNFTVHRVYYDEASIAMQS